MWYTGRALAYGAGPWFNPCWAICWGFENIIGLFSSKFEIGINYWLNIWIHSTPVIRRTGSVLEHLPFTNAACQQLYVDLVRRFHICLGRFSLGTPVSSYKLKIRPFPLKFCPVILVLCWDGESACRLIEHCHIPQQCLEHLIRVGMSCITRPHYYHYTAKLLFHQSPTRHSDHTVTTTMMM